MFIFSEKQKCDPLGQGYGMSLLLFCYSCEANILKKYNPQNTGEPWGFSRWGGPHSPGFKFFGELQTLLVIYHISA